MKTLTYIWVSMVLFIVLASLPACQSVEIIEGLCYNDRDGSHLCPPEKEEVEKEERYRYEDVIEEECDEEWKSYHGHCMKFRNVA